MKIRLIKRKSSVFTQFFFVQERQNKKHSNTNNMYQRWRNNTNNIYNEFKLNKALFNSDYSRMYLDLIDYEGFHDYIACDVTLLPMPTKDLLFPYISHVDRFFKKDFDTLDDAIDKTDEMIANNYSIPKISIDK